MPAIKSDIDQFERILRDSVRAACGTSTYTALVISRMLASSVESEATEAISVPSLRLSSDCIYRIRDYVGPRYQGTSSGIIKSYWKDFVEADYSLYIKSLSMISRAGIDRSFLQYLDIDSFWYIVTTAFRYCVEDNDRRFHHDERAEMKFYEYLDFIISCHGYLTGRWATRLLEIAMSTGAAGCLNQCDLIDFLQDYLIAAN